MNSAVEWNGINQEAFGRGVRLAFFRPSGTGMDCDPVTHGSRGSTLLTALSLSKGRGLHSVAPAGALARAVAAVESALRGVRKVNFLLKLKKALLKRGEPVTDAKDRVFQSVQAKAGGFGVVIEGSVEVLLHFANLCHRIAPTPSTFVCHGDRLLRQSITLGQPTLWTNRKMSLRVSLRDGLRQCGS